MKLILSAIFGLLIYSGVSLAGGSIGGGGGSVQLENPDMEFLQKIYIEDVAYRRLKARLSVGGIKTFPILVGDESVELQKIGSRLVDVNVSREFVSLEGGTLGGGGSGVVSLID
jgi:hypothetical protein